MIPRFTPDHELGKLFSASSLLVLPYTNDFTSQSGVAFMSLAYELPIVASSAGGLKDLFSRFSIGTQFTNLAPAELATAIRQLIAAGSDHLISELKAAKADMSWDRAAEATAQLYDRRNAIFRRAA